MRVTPSRGTPLVASSPARTRDRRRLLERIVGIALIVAASLLVTATGSAWARDRRGADEQIRVTGRAEVTAAPDRVSVDVSVVTRSESAQAAAERNASETGAVIERLRGSFGETAEISTSGYTLAPEFEYDKREGRRKPAGFSARNTVQVVLSDVDAAGRLIDAAVAAGANEVRSVRFSVADASALEQQALVAAAADARAKAEALAASMGLKLGRTLRIEEHGAGPAPTPHAFVARAKAESTPVEPSDVYVEASVALWVELVEK
jgi:uncharacterized protein YggE